MSTNFRTRWHKLLQLVADDNVYLTAPEGSTAPHWDELNTNKHGVKWFLNELSKLPKFVVDSNLLELVMSEGYDKSLVAMRKAGVFRLPFPAMLIEFDYHGNRWIIFLRDNQAKDVEFPWEEGSIASMEASGNPNATQFAKSPIFGMVFSIHSDGDGEYAVMSASVTSVDIEDREGVPFVGLSSQSMEFFPSGDKLNDFVKKTWMKDGAFIFRAMAAAMLIFHTGGVAKEVIECSKMNKKRILNNKIPIPTHTRLHIGKVYRSSKSEQSDDYIPRRSPKPHWRRGYDQPVRYGAGREKIKFVYVNPKLVAYKDWMGSPPEQNKEYVVSK